MPAYLYLENVVTKRQAAGRIAVKKQKRGSHTLRKTSAREGDYNLSQ